VILRCSLKFSIGAGAFRNKTPINYEKESTSFGQSVGYALIFARRVLTLLTAC
jgi:hypothetical protein